MIRLWVASDLIAGAVIPLSVDQSHYLAHVMRCAVGDGIELFNGRDGAWLARVSDIRKKGVVLTVEAQCRAQPAPPTLGLVLALIKRTRLEWAIEKATELGVAEIQLVKTRHSQADHVKLDRLQAIATEAAEQTGRCDVPVVHAPLPLDAVLKRWPADRGLVFCDEAGDAVPVFQIKPPYSRYTVSVLIGPEGGFAPEERTYLRSLSFVHPVSLGPRILRADTAVVAALSVLQSTCGDWH